MGKVAAVPITKCQFTGLMNGIRRTRRHYKNSLFNMFWHTLSSTQNKSNVNKFFIKLVHIQCAHLVRSIATHFRTLSFPFAFFRWAGDFSHLNQLPCLIIIPTISLSLTLLRFICYILLTFVTKHRPAYTQHEN